MKKYKLILCLCLISSLLNSCGKKEEPEPDPVVLKDYQPVSAGSTWTYGGTYAYTITALGTTKEIDGKTYHEFKRTWGGTETTYLLKENGVVSGIGVHPMLGYDEIILLKEEASVGESWEHSSYTGGVITVKKMTIMEKGTAMTVEGKTYKDVIKVNIKRTEYPNGNMNNGFTLNVNVNYFFAKGVGLIYYEYQPSMKVSLLSYTIK